MDDRVVGLVYIAAVAPDAGETVQDQLNRYPSDIFSRVEVADNLALMLPSGTEFFAGDLPEDEQRLVWATHFPRAEAHRRPGRLAERAELVLACHLGPYRPLRPAALGLEPHGRQGHRSRQQPRADAFPARRRHRRDPRGGSRRSKKLIEIDVVDIQ